MNVLVWIIYDISKNKVRSRVAKECKKAGLIRVQQSVFLGRVDINRFDELADAICQAFCRIFGLTILLLPVFLASG